MTTFLLATLLASLAVASDSQLTWTKAREVPSRDAHQAAAANDRFLFAISSTRVAKHDRRTGELIATSTGPAKHLNSGEFWNGRLYLAHSNFPETPEQSQIMVLDPETMALTTWKDFGNFGGSLTWCLRKNDHWWCHFAHYGENNRLSFLVEFDDQWNELRRFTWPANLISQLGKYSLSGAVWHGDDLLLTGHDDPVVFRVRVPAEGTTLSLVRNETVPFTGQGIAFDPTSQGLIGIDRKRRMIILAAPPRP